MTTTRPNPNTAIIAANLEALHIRLQHAMRQVGQARQAMVEKRQNLAIGCIIELEHVLPECDALFRTVLLMHRSRTGFEQNEVHS